jgi:Zn-dependent protease
VLYALRNPVTLLGLVPGFVIGVWLRSLVQAHVGRWLGDRAPELAGRTRLDPLRHLDPFGSVAAALSGTGWARPIEIGPRLQRSRGRLVLVVAAGVLTNLLLAAAGMAGLTATGVPVSALAGIDVALWLHGGITGAVDQVVPVAFGVANLALAVLSLVPIPPLDGGRLLFAYAPRTHGWQVAEYRLADQNWGVLVVLLLLLIPLAGQPSVLLYLIGLCGNALLTAVSHL